MAMHEPADLLRLLLVAGFVVQPVDERLRVTHPDRALPEDWRAAIRQHRMALFDLLIDETIANVRAASAEEQEGWRWEVSHTAMWVEAERMTDPHLPHDLAALRQVVAPGRCLRCDAPCAADGDCWCEVCRALVAGLAEGRR